jgi:hypothetical protein
MGLLALVASLLCGGDGGTPKAPTPLVIYVDAGTPPPALPDDPHLLDDLELLRNYDLLKTYPLFAPDD